MVCELTPQEVKKKELERITRLEGTKLWNTQKEEDLRKKMKEKQEVRKLLENYWPWGRPGGGAPNSHNVGLRNVYLEEMYPQEEMKKAKRQAGAVDFGRSGGGAPHFNKSGHKQIRFQEDPALRFQWGEDLRRTVDNTLRYRAKREDQQFYKKQLDKLVEDKKKSREEELKKKIDFEQKMCLRTPPWGKPGPGGNIWRQPKNLGVNFLKSMGWTTDATIQRIQDELSKSEYYDTTTKNHDHKRHYHHHHHYQDQERKKFNNDIELVPLIIKRRHFTTKPYLGTTDVTRGDTLPQRTNIVEPKYFDELSKQVRNKYQRIKQECQESIKNSEEHFQTWNSLWGRPGHGAPRSAKQKKHLMSLLYPQMQQMSVH